MSEGSRVLRRKCREVTVFKKPLSTLVRDMWHVMVENSGIGLAAPQIGVGQRIFIIRGRDMVPGREVPGVYVNPKIIEIDYTTFDPIMEEGCLSIPGKRFNVRRSNRVVVEAQDIFGESFTVEAEGWYARVIQHEIDHLDGVLIDSPKRTIVRLGDSK